MTGFSTIATTTVAGPYAPRGVDNDDPTWAEGYIIGTDPGFLNRINIRRVSTPGGTPTLGANVTLAVTNTNEDDAIIRDRKVAEQFLGEGPPPVIERQLGTPTGSSDRISFSGTTRPASRWWA